MFDGVLPEKAIKVVGCFNPFNADRLETTASAEDTVLAILERFTRVPLENVNAHVWIGRDDDGAEQVYIPRENWTRVRPRPGARVTIRVVPTRGGGGGVFRAIAAVGIMIASAAFAGPLGVALLGAELAATTVIGSLTLGSLVGGFLISTAGMLLLGGLAPPPQAKLPDASITGNFNTTAPNYSITGTQNRSNPYGAVPRIFGKVRIFPVYGAAPYTEVVGSDQYFRLLFLCGFGPLQLSELKIGTIPLSQFDGVETDIRYGYPGDTQVGLYTNTVNQDEYSQRVENGTPRIFVTRANTQEISLDVTFNGLVSFGNDGSRNSRTVEMIVEYRQQGTVPWTSLGTTAISAATDQAYRYSWRIPNLTAATYEVRVTRVTANSSSSLIRDAVSVTSVRSIKYTPPTVPPGMCLVAMRIKATNQLNGVVQAFNCVAEALLPIWNGTSWSAPTVTRNPAWAYAEVLRGSANMRPLSDSRIDLAAIKEWADACDELDQDGQPRFRYDISIDSRSTLLQTLQNIAGSARASFVIKNGKFSVVRDKPQAGAVQMFTPRNSWGFKGKKVFINQPHALKVRYIEPDRDWAQHEIVVYADGYNAGNATLFETIELAGVTRSSQAWRDGRYHQGVAKLRPEVYELFADFEHLICSRGDKVLVAHDVPRWGTGWGRVRALQVSGSNVVAITIDETITQEAGRSYSLRARRKDASISLHPVNTLVAAALTDTFFLTTPVPVGLAPEVGDLVTVGETTRETVSLVVRSITRGPDMTARLELVDEAPALYSLDTGPIPAFDTQSTWPGQGVNLAPEPPVIAEIRSDEEAMYRTATGFIPAIRLTFAQRDGVAALSDYVEVQFRETGSNAAWRQQVFFDAPSIVWVTPIDDGQQYDLRVRYVSAAGRASAWVYQNSYFAAGRIGKPIDVVAATIHEQNLYWAYPTPANDHAGFMVYWNNGTSDNKATATLAHPADTPVWSPFPMSSFPPGKKTILIYAVDTAGNQSVDPAVVYTDLGDALVENIVETIDLGALGYPGTRAGTVVESGALKGGLTSLFWSDDPNSTFYGADTGAFWPPQLYNDFVYEFTVMPSAAWTPVDLTLDFEVLDATNWSLEYSRRGNVPAWGGANDFYWGAPGDLFWPPDLPLTPWPGRINIGWEPISFRLTANSGSFGGRATVPRLVARFDVPDIGEELVDINLASGGSRLPITKTYRVIKNVRLTLLENGSSAITAKLVDRNAALGPMVQALNGSGVGVAGRVNAEIRGY